MIIRLPWPKRELSPNKSRPGNWWERTRAAKAYRTGCGWEAKAQGAGRIKADRLPVTITFHPPDNRRRDRDNLVASFKAGADGIADVIGVDDSKWEPTYRVGDAVKGGRVVVEIDASRALVSVLIRGQING